MQHKGLLSLKFLTFKNKFLLSPPSPFPTYFAYTGKEIISLLSTSVCRGRNTTQFFFFSSILLPELQQSKQQDVHTGKIQFEAPNEDQIYQLLAGKQTKCRKFNH